MYGQVLLSAMRFFDFHAQDHLALPYMVPQTEHDATENADTPVEDLRFTAPGKLNHRTLVLARLPLHIHTSIVSTLRAVSGCSHGLTDDVCSDCKRKLIDDVLRVQNTNPCLYRFCTELCIAAAIPSYYVREIARIAAEILEIHTEEARAYFKRLDANMSDDCLEYFDKFGSFSANSFSSFDDAGQDDHDVSGIVFPGRRRVRDDVTFQESERSACEKNYASSRKFSPGILTVQCCCDKPILLGYIVMTKPESRSLALTSILSCFPVPPRVLYYDNACNLMASTLIRAPWLLHSTRFLVDRFHFKSHLCSEFFCPDSYRENDADRTTTAEAINSRLERAVPFLRYVNGDLLVPHLSIRFALLNIATKYRRVNGTDDLEDEDLWSYFKSSIQCNCECCEPDGVTAIIARDRICYGLSVPEYETDEELPVVEGGIHQVEPVVEEVHNAGSAENIE